jgi:hypothetical protein
LQNRAAGTSVIIDLADIQIGKWNPTASPRFTSGLLQPDAVQVVARRDDSTARIGTFFYPAFAWLLSLWNNEPVDPNAGQVIVLATATAALSAQSTMAPGGLSIPLGISDNKICGDNIVLHPTKSSCAGWHGFFGGHNSNWIAEILESQVFPKSLRKNKFQNSPTFVSPEIDANETNTALQPDFNNGDIASDFDSFELLFDYMKVRDGDGDDTKWTTSVVIYKDDTTPPDCGPPNGHIMVVGFATFEITMVVGPSAKTFYGKLMCGFTEPGRGGGGYTGTKGSIPGLVQ